MSHFTVLVIGENPEDQLSPYNENIEIPRYASEQVSDEDMQHFVEYYAKKNSKNGKIHINSTFDELYQKNGDDWNSNRWQKHTDGTWWEYSTRNHQSKWDWYVLGGRWTGFFKLKHACVGEVGQPGVFGDPADDGYVDAAQKKDIDFEGMRDDAASKAAERYDKVMVLISHLPVNKSWEEMQELHKDNVKEAREIYWKQERCAVFNDSRELFEIGHNPDEFLIDRDVYIQNARNNAVSTFAVVKDGKWYERGEMGWWACVSNEKDKDQWNEEFAKLLDSVPDDTLLSVYDCHI